MVTFCIIHIGNRKILLKHHPGGMISHSPKCDVWASPIISIWILVFSLENLIFQYYEVISTSKLPFHNPLVMKYYNV